MRRYNCRPSAAAKACSRSRIEHAAGRLVDQRIAAMSSALRGVEFEQHRLDRAERRRRERQRAIADRDQRQRADRLRRQLAAQRHRLAVLRALSTMSRKRAQHRRRDRIEAVATPAHCRDRPHRGTATGRWSRPKGNRRAAAVRRAGKEATALPPSCRSRPARARCGRAGADASVRARPSPWPGRIRRPPRPSETSACSARPAGGLQQRADLAAHQARAGRGRAGSRASRAPGFSSSKARI